MSQPVKIFISYAREDKAYKDNLVKHLKPLERKGIISSWHDGVIEAGQQWETTLKGALETSNVLIFLVSSDFVDSDYINDVEIKKAMERYNSGSVSIVPIWIRPLFEADDFLSRFQALPQDRKPISTWANADEAWVDVVTKLNQLFKRLQSNTNQHHTDNPSSTSVNKKPTVNHNESLSPPQQIRNLVSKGKTKEAIENLIEYTVNNNPDKNQEALLLSSRWNGAERQDRLGLMSYSEIQMERNRINASLLAILEDL